MSSRERLESLEPGFRETVSELVTQLAVMGIPCAITSGRRTMAEQKSLYEQGRTKPGNIVTKAPAGSSPHNYGLAADLCPLKNDQLWWDAPDDVWQAIAQVAQSLGLVAGHYFKSIKDSPHVEHPAWREQQALWKAEKLDIA